MLRFLLVFAYVIILASPNIIAEPIAFPENLEKALLNLNRALANRDNVLEKNEARLDSAKSKLLTISDYSQRIAIYDEIVDGYRRMNMDSVSKYVKLAEGEATAHNDIETYQHFNIKELAILPLKGSAYDAVYELEQVDYHSLSQANKDLFLISARDAALYMFSLYPFKSKNWDGLEKFAEYNDSLLAKTSKSDPVYDLYLGTQFVGKQDYKSGISILEDYLTHGVDTDENALAAMSQLMTCYFYRDRKDMWLYYLAMAAEIEARHGWLDSDCLRWLGSGLYELGDVKHAYEYTFMSTNDIGKNGAYMRSINAAYNYPFIVSAYRSMSQVSTYALYGTIICLVLVVVFIVYFMRNKMRDFKELDRLKNDLIRANEIKEVYLGEFLSLCTTYMDKLDDFNRMVSRKIAAGQVEDLYNMVKSGRYLEDQNKIFYDIFDNAFIQIYPSFIDQVNELLEDGKGFETPTPMKLPTELRILAFMRLGLDDSAQMARFLGLSLNTVYTYRNRIKSKAKNRDSFETDIMNIGNLKH
jgi:uncharacterized protein YozE (UPF0346 family)